MSSSRQPSRQCLKMISEEKRNQIKGALQTDSRHAMSPTIAHLSYCLNPGCLYPSNLDSLMRKDYLIYFACFYQRAIDLARVRRVLKSSVFISL